MALKVEILALLVLALIALVSFLGILSEINQKFGIETPAFGGTLREGIVGSPRFINPLLAQTDADRDMVELVYSGLFRYDNEGKIIPALAEKYEMSQDGLTYTVSLKNKLYWSDGKNLTSDDIIFTVSLAKNPLVQSPKRANWEGVSIEKIDERTISFRLNKPYSPFLENLTLGILPQHLWEKIPPSQTPFAELNTDPIGAGPYKITSVRRDSQRSIVSIKTEANKYFSLGQPHIKTVILYFYPDEERTLRDFSSGALDSLGAISPKNISEISGNNKINKIALKRIIAVFLNSGSNKALASANTRKALNLATDKKDLVEKILMGYGVVIDGPLPRPADENIYDPDEARAILSKQKNEAAFTLTTVKTPELMDIAENLKNMWALAGFNVELKTFPVEDLEQSVIGPRRYDAFLYGEEVVGENPDPFAFWHSSQRTHPGYNIALYANSRVDKMLEEVRATQDAKNKERLYNDIHREIRRDLPAIFLFSPYYIYVTPQNLGGADTKNINTGSDRFSEIHKWYLKRNYVWKIFLK